MIDEFEIVTLPCGPVRWSLLLGVCYKCGKKTCRKCLQLLVDGLLCIKCFAKYMKAVEGNR